MRVRTDVCGSFRLFFVCAQQCAQTALLTAAHRRLCASSPLRTDVCAHLCASIPFYSVRICAHSVRMRTTTICCAQCAQPLRTAILCCAHSVRILCACSPTSVRMRTDTSCAHSVRIAHRRLWKFYPLSVRSAPNAHRCASLVHPSGRTNSNTASNFYFS